MVGLKWSDHEILQARLLEWIAIPLCRGYSWPRDWTQVSCIEGRFFTFWATEEIILQRHEQNQNRHAIFFSENEILKYEPYIKKLVLDH